MFFIINDELSIINYQLSIINYQLSIINYQLSIFITGYFPNASPLRLLTPDDDII
jgi:hypothetical protein